MKIIRTNFLLHLFTRKKEKFFLIISVERGKKKVPVRRFTRLGAERFLTIISRKTLNGKRVSTLLAKCAGNGALLRAQCTWQHRIESVSSTSSAAKWSTNAFVHWYFKGLSPFLCSFFFNGLGTICKPCFQRRCVQVAHMQLPAQKVSCILLKVSGFPWWSLPFLLEDVGGANSEGNLWSQSISKGPFIRPRVDLLLLRAIV